MKTRASLLAFLLLSGAVLRSGGGLELVSLVLVLAALAAALAGVASGRSEPIGRALPWLLGALLTLELFGLGLHPPSAFLAHDRLHGPPLLAAVLLGLLALSYAWPGFPWPRARPFALLAVYFAFGAWLLLEAAPAPAIDVWHFQQHAGALLRRGENPYTGSYPNPYPDDRFLGRNLSDDGTIHSNPYPPLSLLLVLPGHVLGDVRWVLLLALLGSVGLLMATGRRLGLPPGHPAELAAVALLCNPWGVLMVELAWTEPLLALAASLALWAIAGSRRFVLVIALAAVLGLKQYSLLLLPAFAASRRLRWRDVLAAGVLALVTVLPFLLWDPAALHRGVVAFHLQNPLRADSLSLLAALAVATGVYLPSWIGLLAAAGTGVWVMRRGTPTLSTAALGSAAIVLAFFMANRAAHLNYYWLALVFLALAVITTAGESAEAPVADAPGS